MELQNWNCQIGCGKCNVNITINLLAVSGGISESLWASDNVVSILKPYMAGGRWGWKRPLFDEGFVGNTTADAFLQYV